jgi:hypothetical protein
MVQALGLTRLDQKKLAGDKRSSLFSGKKFKTYPPGINVIKLFFFIADDEAK